MSIRTPLHPSYPPLHTVPLPNPSALLLVACTSDPSAFFLRTDRPAADTPSGQPRTLLLSQSQAIDPLAYYAWFYDGSPLYTILGGIAMVAIMLAGVMFPLWPVKLRVGVWYLSIAVLVFIGAMIVLAIVRLIFWCITVLGTKRAIWIFPNLFEDVGFVSCAQGIWIRGRHMGTRGSWPGTMSNGREHRDRGVWRGHGRAGRKWND